MEKSIRALVPSLAKTSLSIAVVAAMGQAAHAADLEGLNALVTATKVNGSSPLVTTHGWKSDNDFCEWYGVTCESNTIVKLELDGVGLSGSIPAGIKEITGLRVLNLADNDFSGEIPEELGTLTSLQLLDLSNNELSGEVPDDLINLTATDGSDNDHGLNLRYNMLADAVSEDTSEFLTDSDSTWLNYQTVAPEGLTASGSTLTSVTLGWTPIAYTADGGYYEVVVSKDTTVDATDEVETTTSKSASSLKISDLDASVKYYYAIRTITERPNGSADELVSEWSDWYSVHTLRDSDGDGIADINDSDADNDGISNSVEGDKDSDGDGLPDYLENNYRDSDSDGKLDYLDDDDDGDGIATANELAGSADNPPDTDVDGIPDYLDRDSSNSADMADGSGDSDEDGRSDMDECQDPPLCVDTDGDGRPDYTDDDDDNDGYKSAEETWTADTDGDGVPDALEPNNMDYDNDGYNNYDDPDDDGDGVTTASEYGGDPYDPIDEDDDNIPDYLDIDTDNDAEMDDDSGDSDGDGYSDYEECPTAPLCLDTNNNGVPTYLDSTESVDYSTGSVLGDSGVKTGGGGSTGLLTLLAGLPLLRRRKH